MSASKALMKAASGVSTGPGAGNAWDVSTAQWLAEDANYATLFSFDTNITGHSFKPDGTKLFAAGRNGESIYEFNLSTPFDLKTLSFVQSLDVSTQDTSPYEIFFKPDGTKMFHTGSDNDSVYEYDLSTAWNISTASFSQSLDLSSQETTLIGLFFRADGAKMYVCGDQGNDVNEFNLSTAWDISSASFVQVKDVSTQETQPSGLFFKDDGTRMYVMGTASDAVHEYSLSTAWDVSSASFSQTFTLSGSGVGETAPRGLTFNADGSVMYISGTVLDSIHAFNLSTAWDISTASYQEPTTRYLDVSAQDNQLQGIFFKPDGLKFYLTGAQGDDINEYDLSTEWDISTASFLQNFSVSGQDNGPQDVFFKPDGLKMYVVGNAGDDINEYDLSTAWDVSSASFSNNKSVSLQETTPQGVFFKPDGLKMYVIGSSSDSVHQYNLSTAWNIGSASFNQSLDVNSTAGNPSNIFFKPDGLRLFVVSDPSSSIFEFDLSTAWDISTASYNSQNFNFGYQDINPEAVFFKPDGLKMYISGAETDAIYEYDL